MATLIPFRPSIPFYDFSTTIKNVEYRFDVRWNGRDDRGAGAWYFDVSESDGTKIVEGAKITLGVMLARSVNHPLFREGILVVVDTGNAAGNGVARGPTFDDLGVTADGVQQRVQVMHLQLDEYLSLREAAAFPDEVA